MGDQEMNWHVYSHSNNIAYYSSIWSLFCHCCLPATLPSRGFHSLHLPCILSLLSSCNTAFKGFSQPISPLHFVITVFLQHCLQGFSQPTSPLHFVIVVFLQHCLQEIFTAYISLAFCHCCLPATLPSRGFHSLHLPCILSLLSSCNTAFRGFHSLHLPCILSLLSSCNTAFKRFSQPTCPLHFVIAVFLQHCLQGFSQPTCPLHFVIVVFLQHCLQGVFTAYISLGFCHCCLPATLPSRGFHSLHLPCILSLLSSCNTAFKGFSQPTSPLHLQNSVHARECQQLSTDLQLVLLPQLVRLSTSSGATDCPMGCTG